MIQIISYEIKNTVLTVGFKVDNFVVYSSIGYDEDKIKQQLLQLAYQQIKQTIDYEKTLTEHGFITDEVGDEFIPEEPIVNKIFLVVDKNHIEFVEGQETSMVTPIVLCKDQYGDAIEAMPTYTISYGDVVDGILEIPSVVEYMEITITAIIDGISDIKTIYVFPYMTPKPSEINLLNNRIQELESTIDIILGGEIIE